MHLSLFRETFLSPKPALRFATCACNYSHVFPKEVVKPSSFLFRDLSDLSRYTFKNGDLTDLITDCEVADKDALKKDILFLESLQSQKGIFDIKSQALRKRLKKQAYLTFGIVASLLLIGLLWVVYSSL